MAHTADIFLVDAQGMLRARFPFGTAAEPIDRRLSGAARGDAAAGRGFVPPVAPVRGSATPAPSTARHDRPFERDGHAGCSRGHAVAGDRLEQHLGRARRPRDPHGGGRHGAPLDGSVPVTARMVGRRDPGRPRDGRRRSSPRVRRQPRSSRPLDIPVAGWWRLERHGGQIHGRDIRGGAGPRRLTPIGGPAPDIDTPTLDDVGGDALAVTTQPAPGPAALADVDGRRARDGQAVRASSWTRRGSRCRPRAAGRSRWSATCWTAGARTWRSSTSSPSSTRSSPRSRCCPARSRTRPLEQVGAGIRAR